MDEKGGYRWEQAINATWESVQEDEEGRIVSVANERTRAQRARQQRITQSIRRGLIRYLVVAVDCSSSALQNDYRPSRLEGCKNALKNFVIDYYDQNPISQLAIIATKNKIAEKVSDLSGNSKNHVHQLEGILKAEGLASLQNTILLALSTLKYIPNYGHRELLIVYNSLSTCDPSDIYATIKEAKKQKLRISVICLAAELFICRQIAELTGGSFSVALDSSHLKELLQAQTVPPPETMQETDSLVTDFIYMGFPKRTFDSLPQFGYDGKRLEMFHNAFVCPRCQTRSSDIPTQCNVCGLQLNSSSHIARSFHHLFPVPNFVEYNIIQQQIEKELRFVAEKNNKENNEHEEEDMQELPATIILDETNSNCTSCFQHIAIQNKLVFLCPSCNHLFCVDCDLFIHDTLHNCPSCYV